MEKERKGRKRGGRPPAMLEHCLGPVAPPFLSFAPPTRALIRLIPPLTRHAHPGDAFVTTQQSRRSRNLSIRQKRCKVTALITPGATVDPQAVGPLHTLLVYVPGYLRPAPTILCSLASCPSPYKQDSGNLCRAIRIGGPPINRTWPQLLLIIPRASLPGAKRQVAVGILGVGGLLTGLYDPIRVQ